MSTYFWKVMNCYNSNKPICVLCTRSGTHPPMFQIRTTCGGDIHHHYVQSTWFCLDARRLPFSIRFCCWNEVGLLCLSRNIALTVQHCVKIDNEKIGVRHSDSNPLLCQVFDYKVEKQVELKSILCRVSIYFSMRKNLENGSSIISICFGLLSIFSPLFCISNETIKKKKAQCSRCDCKSR